MKIVIYSTSNETLICDPKHRIKVEEEYFRDGGRDPSFYSVTVVNLKHPVLIRPRTIVEPHGKGTEVDFVLASLQEK